jgi:hypothetical protein
VAVEARLFGRLRLLTLEAVIDVAKDPTPIGGGLAGVPSLAGGAPDDLLIAGPLRRSDAEDLLREAEAVLQAARATRPASG